MIDKSELDHIKALMAKATKGPWRSHDHNSMARFGNNPADWIGYAWVGHGGDENGNFDSKIADLDARKDGSPEWREQAHRNSAYIAASHNIMPRLIEEIEAANELLRRSQEELRLLRMKDTGAVYDVTLRTDLSVRFSSSLEAAERVGPNATGRQ